MTEDLKGFTDPDSHGCFSECDVVRQAIRDGRKDILAALEIGKLPPINKKEYWVNFYTSKLGTPYVNYWDWKANPESMIVCPELTQLLSLPDPSKEVKEVLQAILDGDLFTGQNSNPFRKAKQTVPTIQGYLASTGRGKLDIHPNKSQLHKSFINWYQETISHIGIEALMRVFKVLYHLEPEILQKILEGDSERIPLTSAVVLGIDINSTLSQVKAAYKAKAKVCHPDTGGNAADFQHLTRAYESALQSFKVRA